MAVENETTNTYEEARKQRLEENKKRFQDLGILNISKSLTELAQSEKKPKQRFPKLTPEKPGGPIELRRSSRERKPIPSYRDDLDIELSLPRKRSRPNSSWTSYISRPLEEVRLASYQERMHALRIAEKFENSLQSGNPSFVKSMVRSHVYSCFWLGLPTQFCKNHLPEKDLDMILEDENGTEYDSKYLGKRAGLSGGWRGFALDHKLDDGDALVFELVEPDRFKVYIFRVSSSASKKEQAENAVEDEDESREKKKNSTQTKKKKRQVDQNGKFSKVQKPQQQDVTEDEETSADAIANRTVAKKRGKKGRSTTVKTSETQPVRYKKKGKKPVSDRRRQRTKK